MFYDNYFLQLIFLLNVLSYFLYYVDKKRAIKKHSRISENTLLLATFLFGGLGAWLSMRQFHHKTKQMKFRLLVPIAAILTFIASYYVINIL